MIPRFTQAATRRASRARQRHANALAGGWGLQAQQSAWAALLPSWREAVALVAASMRGGGLSEDDWSQVKSHAAAIKGYGPTVGRAWIRLLHQYLQRRLDAAGGPHHFGGYPVS